MELQVLKDQQEVKDHKESVLKDRRESKVVMHLCKELRADKDRRESKVKHLRLKKNVRPYAEGVQTLLGIESVRFQYNGLYGTPTDNREVIGIVANQLETVIPEAIFRIKGKLSVNDLEETDILHYDEVPMIMVCINAIKEHTKSIDSLMERVKELEERLQAKIQ
jgi:hypothetical protein